MRLPLTPLNEGRHRPAESLGAAKPRVAGDGAQRLSDRRSCRRCKVSDFRTLPRSSRFLRRFPINDALVVLYADCTRSSRKARSRTRSAGLRLSVGADRLDALRRWSDKGTAMAVERLRRKREPNLFERRHSIDSGTRDTGPVPAKTLRTIQASRAPSLPRTCDGSAIESARHRLPPTDSSTTRLTCASRCGAP